MTNSLNTPVEVLEHAYPVRVRRYMIRLGSGGVGKFRGGDGIVREIELLVSMHVGMLSDRRKFGPYGLSGGEPGATGENEIVIGGRRKQVPAKGSFYAPSGAIVRIETPGGGGWGRKGKK
jgi:N-methylhydantoinase B